MSKATLKYWKNLATYGGLIVAVGTLVVLFIWREFDNLAKMLPLQVNASVSTALVPMQGQNASLSARLEKIETTMEILEPEIQAIINAGLSKAASMPEKDFRQTLPSLHRTLTAARLLRVPTDQALLTRISLKLYKTDKSSHAYWPTAAEFVSYRSEVQQSHLLAKFGTSEGNIPLCRDTKLHPSVVLSVPTPKSFTASLPYYEGCKFSLDDKNDQARIKVDLYPNAVGIAFRNALIEYHGGEISIPLLQDLHDRNRKISSLVFEQCLYDFMMTQEPSPDAQKILTVLLLETSGDIEVPPGTVVFQLKNGR